MHESKMTVPVLFLIFNRPDTTQQVFDEIRKARPTQLFVAADGPRKNRLDDREKCRKAREIVKHVDWDCAVSTLFRDENLGCKKGVSSAIDWFFSNVNEGIILEDDCVPDQSFFPFCQELLERYRNDERVLMISGTNYLANGCELVESYFFSKYYSIWGWATWKRAWSLYDIEMTHWPIYNSRRDLHEIYREKYVVNFFEKIMQKTYDNKLDTWDVQWVYTCIFNYGLSICPKFNLVSNVGNMGTHTIKPGTFQNLPRQEIELSKFIHPVNVLPRYDLDSLSFNLLFKNESIFQKILSFVSHHIKNY